MRRFPSSIAPLARLRSLSAPLTNIAAALGERPDLRANLARLIAVMGRCPGHILDPAEGKSSTGIRFRHGPLFRDFNVDKVRSAATQVLAMAPTTLVLYEAARGVRIDQADLARMSPGAAAAWVAERSRAWLSYWNDEVGVPGYYPFDGLAAAYVVAPDFSIAPKSRCKSRTTGRSGFRGDGHFGLPALLVVPKVNPAVNVQASAPVPEPSQRAA